MDGVAVLGPGGVGGFLAAALSRAGIPVTVIAREETAALIERQGITVQSLRLGEFVARPAVDTVLAAPVQALIVAPKATMLRPALDRVRADPELVVPLLNGLDHMEVLRGRFGPHRVAAGTIRVEADRTSPGTVVQTSPFLRVELAADDRRLAPALERLAGLLTKAGIPAQIGPSEAQILWSKLVRLCALACTTAASDQSIGFIRTDPEWRAALTRCIEEAAAVARASGAQIDPAGRLAELDEAHPGLGSSMQRDIAAGREPELDAIAGSVLRAGRRHGLECPTVQRLAIGIARRAGIDPPHET